MQTLYQSWPTMEKTKTSRCSLMRKNSNRLMIVCTLNSTRHMLINSHCTSNLQLMLDVLHNAKESTLGWSHMILIFLKGQSWQGFGKLWLKSWRVKQSDHNQEYHLNLILLFNTLDVFVFCFTWLWSSISSFLIIFGSNLKLAMEKVQYWRRSRKSWFFEYPVSVTGMKHMHQRFW